MAGKKCPKCESLWDERDYFCGLCGTRLVFAHPQAEAAEAGSHPAVSRGWRWFLETFPGFTRLKVLLISAVVFVLALGTLALAFSVFCQGIYDTGFAIGVGGFLLYWTSLSWMMYGHICAPIEAMAEFQGRHWTVLTVATIIPASVFMLVIKLASDARKPGV